MRFGHWELPDDLFLFDILKTIVIPVKAGRLHSSGILLCRHAGLDPASSVSRRVAHDSGSRIKSGMTTGFCKRPASWKRPDSA
jgi:hypothetical protein